MSKDIPLEERIIFALDVDSLKAAEAWVDRLGSLVRFYKVGLELFLAAGFPVLDMIAGHGHKVMLDLKFFDIPETVAKAVRQVRGRGASLLTVHGNAPIVRAAVAEKGEARVLAVTVLTSFGQDDLRELGATRSVEEVVLARARQAQELGCDGIVCSGLEAARLRRELGGGLLMVTPGIRPGTAGGDDQKRVATAGQAIRGGADHLVIGRPISTANDPLTTVAMLQDEVRDALTEREAGT